MNIKQEDLTEPDGTSLAYSYDASGQRASASVVNDAYQLGHLAYQTNAAGALLASYTDDASGVPESVQVGSDPATAPRYYYVYDARGDVVNLTDGSGAVVASYAYDPWGALTSASESIPNANGWVNPYRYDGRDGVRFDAATGLDWMSTRAYDPSLGRFISRDPLGRVPLFLASNDNPYVYAGNNPLSNVDPSGQYRVAGQGATRAPSEPFLYHPPTHVVTTTGKSQSGAQPTHVCDPQCQHDTQLILDYLELTRAQNHLGADVLALIADTAIAVVDYVAQSWISFVADVVTLIVQAMQVGKDVAIVHGASAQSLIGLNEALSVMQGIVIAMNAVLAIGWFALLANGPGGIVSGGFKAGVKFIMGTFGSTIKVAGAWSSMTDDFINVREAQVAGASPQQRYQICTAMNLRGC